MNHISNHGHSMHHHARRRLILLLGIVACLSAIAILKMNEIRTLVKTDATALLAFIKDPGQPSAATQKTQLAPVRSAVATGPLGVSAQNPRYFADPSGKIVYLTGSHTWLNLQDGVLTDPPPAFDYSGWLDYLVANNHNFFRLWTWEEAKWVTEAKQPYYFSPMPYARTGPGTARDGKPKFDLTKFNPDYFDRLRQRVIEARERGIYVSVMLFDGWSISYPKGSHDLANPWVGHPFNKDNNINRVDGDPNGNDSGDEIQTLALPEVTRLQEAYVRQVIETVHDLDNVLYEISNESNLGADAWQYHMIDFIKAYESQKNYPRHPVGMTSEFPNGKNEHLYASPADWISPNGGLDAVPEADGRKVVIADTDHLCGICGDRNWVWRSFTRGQNPLFMDQYDDSYKLNGGGYDRNNPNDVALRKNLGYTLTLANCMDMAKMTPHGELASSGYALANPAAAGAEYLVYFPKGGSGWVDLTRSRENYRSTWLRTETGAVYDGPTIPGGKVQSFSAPFSGSAVLYLHPAQVKAPPVVQSNPFRTTLPVVFNSAPGSVANMCVY